MLNQQGERTGRLTNRTKVFLILLALAANVLYVSGCAAEETGSSTPALNASQTAEPSRATPLPIEATGKVDVDDVWTLAYLDVCTLPCWLNITPGTTTPDHAQDIVEQYFDVSEESVGEDDKFLRWFLFENSPYYSYILIKDGVVENIVLSLNNGDLVVDEAIQKLGPPSIVLILFGELSAPEDGCSEGQLLFYPRLETALVLANRSSTQILPETSIVDIRIAPDLWGGIPGAAAHPIVWHGYSETYCLPNLSN